MVERDMLQQLAVELDVIRRAIQADEPRRTTYAHVVKAKALADDLLVLQDRGVATLRLAAE